MAVHPAIAADNVAVITGGASGIGLAAGRALAAAGMKVALLDRDGDRLAAVLAADCGAALALETDVANREALAAVAARIRTELGPVSVLMNNAGIGGGGDALSNPDGWARVLDVNLMGVLNGVQEFVPEMIAGARPGLVINTGSKQGITQPPGDTAYNVSKAGVKALTEGLAHTLRGKVGDRVTAHLLIPGFTYTGLIAAHIPQKPAGAWDPEQVVERMFEGLARGEFYILCQDNETTREQDEKRMLWAVRDIIDNRPALSRWHPDYKDAFEKFMSDD
ncbi:MAG TPA: SDR family NAD(P)-dependent oxidoreductase [Caulobacteraceae bacterium]|nr:SDR family NAD(P)-dependent oxidoreductase [Caulobacteraceae bacterium]